MTINYKRMMGIILMFSLLFALFPATVFAAETQRTTTLDLRASEFAENQENTDEGWSWNAETSTLTLTNVNFSTEDEQCIIVPGDRDVYLNLVGNNTLTSNKTVVLQPKVSGKPDATLIISGDSLQVNSTGEMPTFDVTNFTLLSGSVTAIGGSVITVGTINIIGGSIVVDTTAVSDDGWNDGLYACSSIEISGGTVDIKAGRIAMFITGTGHPDPLLGLSITDGDITLQGALSAVYAGIDNPKDIYIATNGTLTVSDSPVGIYSYDGDITIEKGNFITDNPEQLIRSRGDNTGTTTIADADYSRVSAAIAKADSLNKEDYEDFSSVQAAIDAVEWDKNVLEQVKVNEMAAAIENAIAALVPVEDTTVNSYGIGLIFPRLYTVKTSCTLGGKLNASETFYIAYGASRTIKITPDEGYEIKDVLVDGRSVGAVDSYTIKAATKNYSIAVTFEKID